MTLQRSMHKSTWRGLTAREQSILSNIQQWEADRAAGGRPHIGNASQQHAMPSPPPAKKKKGEKP